MIEIKDALFVQALLEAKASQRIKEHAQFLAKHEEFMQRHENVIAGIDGKLKP